MHLVKITRDIHITGVILHPKNQETEVDGSEVTLHPASSLLRDFLQLHISLIHILCQQLFVLHWDSSPYRKIYKK